MIETGLGGLGSIKTYYSLLDDTSIKSPQFDINPQQLNNTESMQKYNYLIKIFLNLSCCYLKLNDYIKVITWSSKVITLDKKNIKALFLRAKAYRIREELCNAKQDLITIKNMKILDKMMKIKLKKELKLIAKQKIKNNNDDKMLNKYHGFLNENKIPDLYNHQPIKSNNICKLIYDEVCNIFIELFNMLFLPCCKDQKKKKEKN